MARKEIVIKPKAKTAAHSQAAEEWVDKEERTVPGPASLSRQQAEEKMKRLTIDIPADLHRQIKTGCAARGEKMADVVRELLLREFGSRS